jgi:hypothetical protein
MRNPRRVNGRRAGGWVLLGALALVAADPAGVSAQQATSLLPPDGAAARADADRAASWRLLAGADLADEPPGDVPASTPAADAPGNPGPLGGGVPAPADDAGLLENLSLFLGLTGSKGPEDLGINANFGFRTAVNWGFPVLEPYGLGVQAGTSLNYSRTAVRVLRAIDGTRDRFENFSTVGLFQRSPWGVNWGLVYDFVDERYYSHFDLGQWRGQVGYDVTANDEAGLWGAWREHGDGASVGNAAFALRPILQGNLFWRHTWGIEAQTRFWLGVAEGHGRFIYLAPGQPPVHHPVVFGADLYVPLTDSLAIFGEANFITPNDSGTVAASLGVVFYPGGGARRASRSRFAPLLPLANNPTFATDLQQ